MGDGVEGGDLPVGSVEVPVGLELALHHGDRGLGEAVVGDVRAAMDDDAVARGGTKDVAGGVVGDLIRLGEVLLKGGHIVKKKDGRV